MKAEVRSKLNLDTHVPLQDVIPLDTPFLFYVDPSSACNFRCLFCPSGHREAIKQSGYPRSVMSLELFEKVIRDLGEFDRPIKVLRMNKIGEPFLNRKLPQMVACAKQSGFVECIDLATNGSLLTRENMGQLVEAGLDRLNISVEGVNREQYVQYAGHDMDFQKLVEHVQWLASNKGDCEVTIKIPGNYLSEGQKEEFFGIFGDYCDRIFIEDIAPIWPFFDVEAASGIQVSKREGQYKQVLQEKEVCTYIFYAAAVNADGTVSACCPDWEQKLVVGDVRTEPLKRIWHSPSMNVLRRQHLEGRRCAHGVCSQCGHVNFCQVDNIDPYREMLLRRFESYERECLT